MTKEQAIEILSLQDKLNIDTVGKDWKLGKAENGRVVDYPLCVGMEASELLDSLNWKHWKDIDAPDNWVNAEMEVVDIIHFIASWALQDKEEKLFAFTMSEVLIVLDSDGELIPKTKMLIYKSMAEYPDLSSCLIQLKTIMSIMNIDNTVYNLYIGKNVLNKFRQDNGYANGTYVKIWNGYEDNVTVARILDEMDDKGEAVNPETLYSRLKHVYQIALEEAGVS